jgi:hypothetical protein
MLPFISPIKMYNPALNRSAGIMRFHFSVSKPRPVSFALDAMTRKPSQISSLLVAAYVAVVVGGTLLHFANTGDVYTLKYSFTRPATIIAMLVGVIVAFGLWRSYAWAWWLGLIAVGVQLYRFGPWFAERLVNDQVPIGSWLIAFLLVAFLALHLTKAVRKSCSR